jgi:hypothetical protein
VPQSHRPPPRGAGKAAIIVVTIVGLMVLAIFVGFNIYHAKTLKDEQAGHVDPASAPKGTEDLGSAHARH